MVGAVETKLCAAGYRAELTFNKLTSKPGDGDVAILNYAEQTIGAPLTDRISDIRSGSTGW